MSNAKFRLPEPATSAPPQPAAPKARLTPIQAMAKCIRDHRLFALYIELGGAAIDAIIEHYTRVMRAAKPCMDRELASEREEMGQTRKEPRVSAKARAAHDHHQRGYARRHAHQQSHGSP